MQNGLLPIGWSGASNVTRKILTLANVAPMTGCPRYYRTPRTRRMDAFSMIMHMRHIDGNYNTVRTDRERRAANNISIQPPAVPRSKDVRFREGDSHVFSVSDAVIKRIVNITDLLSHQQYGLF